MIGLDVAEGIELLRKQGVETRQAIDEELRMAVTHCEGHALSLMLLASLLRHNRGLSLPLLLKDPLYAQLWHGDIARNLLDYIYARQLQEAERKLLEAFSVYRKPVPLEAALALLDPLSETDRKQVLKTLKVLLAQHLLQASGDALYNHTLSLLTMSGNALLRVIRKSSAKSIPELQRTSYDWPGTVVHRASCDKE